MMNVLKMDKLPNGWKQVELGEVASLIQNGIYKPSENYGHGHPFIRMYNIQSTSYKLNLNPLAKIALTEKELKAFELEAGDLLISRVNSFELVGKCAWVDKQARGYIFENMLIRLRFNASIR